MKHTRILIFIILLSALSANSILGQSKVPDKKDTLKVKPQTIDVPPVPPGGAEGYNIFLAKNIKYPQSAVDAGASGTVWISIVVDKDGTLTDIHVVKDGAGFGCAEEAVRVIKEMPPWKPGTMNGAPVKVQYTIPVKFVLTWGRPGIGGSAASDKDSFYSERCNSDSLYWDFNVPPAPKGGVKAYNRFIKKHLVYPPLALSAKASGTVYLYIVVCEDGTVSNVHIEQDNIGYGCGEEAARVIKLMPKWKPARFHGKRVNLKYIIPVKFELP